MSAIDQNAGVACERRRIAGHSGNATHVRSGKGGGLSPGTGMRRVEDNSVILLKLLWRERKGEQVARALCDRLEIFGSPRGDGQRVEGRFIRIKRFDRRISCK